MSGQVFLGYPSSPPLLRETMANAASALNDLGDVHVTSWEDLIVSGRVLWDAIAAAIDIADVAAFEITHLNPNVCFELGYAIGRNKPIWPLRDTSDVTARPDFEQLGAMLTVGYVSYANSEDVRGKFLAERPDIQRARFFEESVQPHLEPTTAPSVFHLAGAVNTEASRALSRAIQSTVTPGLAVVTADPAEASFQPLTWYAQHIYNSHAVLGHLVAPSRVGAELHNLRIALAAGIAVGLDRPLLLLAEREFAAPLDFRDLVFVYDTAQACGTRTAYWLPRQLDSAKEAIEEATARSSALKMTTELRSLNIGEYVAENEAKELERYWVETAVYREVVGGVTRIIAGRKGAGKSATLLQAATELQRDRRNVVCVIKPEGYDLEGLVRLLDRYRARDSKGYLVESLWKYLLLTEVAISLERDLLTRPAGSTPGTPEWDLTEYLRDQGRMFETDFAVRLERAVENLLMEERGTSGIESERVQIAERLHAGPIRQLRTLVAAALRERDRVCILVDNLDKSWERSGAVPQLVDLILGLVGSIEGFGRDLEQAQRRASLARITVAVFVRTDIYSAVATAAREPDKLPTTRLQWPDRDALTALVERRYAAGRSDHVDPAKLWERYFTATVRGMSTVDYLTHVTFPRPRDLLYLVRAAVDIALTRRHARVEEQDVLKAEHAYSQFAFEAMRVETQIDGVDVDELLLQFAGAPPVMDETEVYRYIGAAGGNGKEEHVVDQLRDLGFLGVQTGPDKFVFSDDPQKKRMSDVLSGRLRADGHLRRLRVNRALWAFLEIAEQESLTSRP